MILENAYRTARGRLSDKQVQGLAKQLDWTARQVERWLRLKNAQHRPTVLSKFTESAWRCTFYFVSFVYGCYVLWDKPWMWDSMYCFIDYPHHVIRPAMATSPTHVWPTLRLSLPTQQKVSSGEWFYYNFESAFYLALLFSQFFDVQRKVSPKRSLRSIYLLIVCLFLCVKSFSLTYFRRESIFCF